MKIHGWHIDGYGVHHDLAAADLPAGLTVVTGPNEAGKTTLQHFLIGMLFGFTASNRADHHAPLRGGAYGGRLLVTDDEGTAFTIHRGARRSSLRITGPDGPVADPEAELRRLLGGATKDLYLALFAVHTDELDELKALTDDQVRDRVFSAGILGAGRTAQAALTQLAAERDELWKPGGRSADKYRLRRLRDQLTVARTDLAEARREAAGLPGLLHRIAAVEADRDRTYAARTQRQDQRSLLFVVANQWPTWAEAAEARGELDQLGVIDPLPGDAAPVLHQLVGRRDDLRAEAEEAADRLAAARGELAAIPAPGIAPERRLAIAELAAALPVERERELAIARLTAAAAATERELAAEDRPDTTVADPSAAAEARALAAAVTAAEQRCASVADTVRRERVTLDDDLEELVAQEAALAGRTAHPADRARHAVEQANALLALLTQRDAIAEQPAPPAPTPVLAGLAAVSLVGALAALGTGAPLIGALLVVLAIGLGALTVASRRDAVPAIDGLDDAIAPLLREFGLAQRPTLAEATQLRVRAEQLATEATELERSRSDVAARRATLDARAQRLTSRHADEQQAAHHDLEAARDRWASWLRDAGLDAGLDADGVGELLEAAARARALQRTLATQQAELATATAARDAFAQQVAALTGPTDRPLEALAALDEARLRDEAAQRELDQQTIAVRAADDHHRRAAGRAVEAGAALDGHLDRLGVATIDAALEAIARADRAAQLRRTIAQAERDLLTSIGPDAGRLDAARALLTRADPVRWQLELDEHDRELKAVDARIEEQSEELAHLKAERDQLERSADVATAELRVADLEAQLVDAVTRWATLQTAHQLVEATLARYQRERQPDVVKRAAVHFAQITGGRYQRLEVRDREIVAIDHSEREVRADQLSKGATQQLYLCMRFALAESYARTTALPLLLDDIAVHADDGRLPRLAETIATVAADHQVLVFASHRTTVEQLTAATPGAAVIELEASAPARRIGLAAG